MKHEKLTKVYFSKADKIIYPYRSSDAHWLQRDHDVESADPFEDMFKFLDTTGAGWVSLESLYTGRIYYILCSYLVKAIKAKAVSDGVLKGKFRYTLVGGSRISLALLEDK